MAADEIIIETVSAEVIEVGVPGPQGPAGAAGAGLTTLTTAGDLLYRNATEATRLPVGSNGQVLKVSGGLPAWGNESGAVTSVNGATGAVTVAAAQHAAEHEPGYTDAIQATAALVTTNLAGLNGIYFSDDTSTNGKLNFFRTGTRKNTKLQYNSNTLRWELIRNLTVEAESIEDDHPTPWDQSWSDPRTPAQVTSITVARVALETMVQKLAETGTSAVATTSEDGLFSAADKTKLNGIAANATANTASSATPSALGTASAGSATDYARADHTHSAEVSDSAFRVTGSTDATKKVAIEVDTNVPANTTVTLTAPSASGTLALANHTHDVITSTGGVNKFKLGLGGDSAMGRFVGVTTADDPLIGVLSYEDENAYDPDSEVRSSRFGMTLGANNSVMFAQYLNDGVVQAQYDFKSPSGVIAVLENEGDGLPTLNISALSENRTYDLPDASGTLALTSDIPANTIASTIVDAKGDLIVGTAADTVARLPVGATNGHVLTVDSAEASGMKWAAASGGVTSVSGTAPIVSSGGTTPTISVTTGSTANTVCAGDDARLSDARSPLSHTHGNITNGGLVGTTSGLPLKTGTGGIVEAGAFGTSAGQFAEGNHTHSQLHDRSHAIASTSDHTATAWRVFYSNGSGEVTELALGSSGQVLTSNGASAAPSFAAASGGVSAMQSIAINFVLN